MSYKAYFGFKKDPFTSEVPIKELLKLPAMVGAKERIDYCLDVGGVTVITGEVGSGKSTAIRWALAHYHPSEIKIVSVVANSGSLVDLYKLISWGLDLNPGTTSKARLSQDAKATIREIVATKKQKVLIVIDEANLMRPDVFFEIHTLTQFDHDSKNFVSLVLCGQATLLDKLTYRASMPLASRVIARAHSAALSKPQLDEYITHHLTIAGIKKGLFDSSAVMGIHQGSGGILRKSNALARGGLIAAAIEQKEQVTAEHIRIAASELI